MPVTPIPYRTAFLEKDSSGKQTGNVSWAWIKWFMELEGVAPIDPNALFALTIEQAPTVDLAEQAAADAILAAQPQPNPIDSSQVEELASGMTLALTPPPATEPEYVNGPLVKSQSVTTGSIAALTYATVTLTWTTPFWDLNYLAYAEVLQAVTTAATLRVHHIESVSATQIKVGVYNDDAGGAHTGTLHVLAIHN